MQMNNMTFYVKHWKKSYPINDENIKRFANAKVSCVNLSKNRIELTFQGIGQYVKYMF